MKITLSFRNVSLMATMLFAITSCVKDPYDDVITNERAIEAVALGGDFVQVGPAVVDRVAGHVSVQVLIEDGTDLKKVAPILRTSYKASVSPASGEVIDFASNDNKHTYTITAESGKKREWVVELVPFTETLPGTYKITGQVLYGGTGPEWGGGAVMDLTSKHSVWPETDGPAAELDNTLVFEFSGVTPEGHTHGTITNSPGEDGLYADYQFVQIPATDVNHFYRKIPKGEGTWLRNYAAQTISLTFADGSTVTGSFIGAQNISLGNNLSKTVTNHALDFTLNGTDDWVNFNTDYDKIVKRPRRFWIDLEKQP
jgi:hypothetical protein